MEHKLKAALLLIGWWFCSVTDDIKTRTPILHDVTDRRQWLSSSALVCFLTQLPGGRSRCAASQTGTDGDALWTHAQCALQRPCDHTRADWTDWPQRTHRQTGHWCGQSCMVSRSVSCAGDIDVTMTSRLLTLMMLATLTSCQNEYDSQEDNFGGQSASCLLYSSDNVTF